MINEGHVFLGDDGTATVHFHPKEEENEGKYQIFLNAKKKKNEHQQSKIPDMPVT